MNARDQEKVCHEGFTILRADERNGKPIIKFKDINKPDSWRKMKKEFKSKAERDRYMKELFEENFWYIED
ncbi:hypothetical protein [Phocaeicola plebeius]|jgi:hypothetical protein|uniref:hypothetical protein n=1 Tax=Phocaeicola plebeius TaxID=310297 RepID=UPI00205D8732|nr:MAG TPA: hypothetical protein [Caudoviricetes sp.]